MEYSFFDLDLDNSVKKQPKFKDNACSRRLVALYKARVLLEERGWKYIYNKVGDIHVRIPVYERPIMGIYWMIPLSSEFNVELSFDTSLFKKFDLVKKELDENDIAYTNVINGARAKQPVTLRNYKSIVFKSGFSIVEDEEIIKSMVRFIKELRSNVLPLIKDICS